MPVFRSELTLLTKRMNKAQEVIVDILSRKRDKLEVPVGLIDRTKLLEVKIQIDNILDKCKKDEDF